MIRLALVSCALLPKNMAKDTLLPSQPKGVYRVKNWPEYIAGLIARGDATIWIDEAMLCPAVQGQASAGTRRPTATR